MKSLDQIPTQEQRPVIEEARPEDAEGIARVRKATWLATYPNEERGITYEDVLEMVKDFESEAQIESWRKAIEDKTGPRKLWVARDKDDNVVGYSQGRKTERGQAILGMYILPTQEGKGIGSALMREVMHWLDEDRPVTLSVAEYGTRAIALYKKFGFIETDEQGVGPKLSSGKEIPSIKMMRPAKQKPPQEPT